ncbi:MAG: PDZ domain-containing protein, partial [Myxococcota bacterium]
PAPIIRHFLSAIEETPRLTIPLIGVATQGLENSALRSHLGLASEETGVMVVSVPYGGSAHGVLEVGDAILAIEGYPIANNSTIRYLGRYRTRYDVMMGWKNIGDPLKLRILRDGQRKEVTLSLQGPTPLVPSSQYDTVPTYFVYGGLVFQVLCRDFLATWDRWWNKAPKEFLYLYYSGERTEERTEVVILTQILADAINVGYSHLYNEAIASVNGVPPRDMAHFVALLEAQGDDEVVIQTSSRGLIVLNHATVQEANARILARYRITRDRSLDLMASAPSDADAQRVLS